MVAVTVHDRRRAFCFQYVHDLEHLRRHVAPELRLVAIAVYRGLTEIANEERAREAPEGFEAARRRIAARSCVSPRSVDNAIPELERVGLIKVIRRSRKPSTFILIEAEGLSHDVQLQEVQQKRVQQAAAPGATTHSHQVQTSQEDVSEEEEDGGSAAKGEFEEWLADYVAVTGYDIRGSSEARRLFIDRRRDWSLADLKLATRGAHADAWRREHGQDSPEFVLRASNVESFRLVATRDSRSDLARMAAFVGGDGLE